MIRPDPHQCITCGRTTPPAPQGKGHAEWCAWVIKALRARNAGWAKEPWWPWWLEPFGEAYNQRLDERVLVTA